MSERLLTISEAVEMLGGVASKPTLYKWIRRGSVSVERGPNGRMKIRESEVQRVVGWFNGEVSGDARLPLDD